MTQADVLLSASIVLRSYLVVCVTLAMVLFGVGYSGRIHSACRTVLLMLLSGIVIRSYFWFVGVAELPMTLGMHQVALDCLVGGIFLATVSLQCLELLSVPVLLIYRLWERRQERKAEKPTVIQGSFGGKR